MNSRDTKETECEGPGLFEHMPRVRTRGLIWPRAVKYAQESAGREVRPWLSPWDREDASPERAGTADEKDGGSRYCLC